MSTEIHAEVEIEEHLTLVAEQAAQLLQATGGLGLLLTPRGEALQVVATAGLPADFKGITLAKDEDMAGAVLQHRRPVLVEDYQQSAHRSTHFQAAPFGPVLALPLHTKTDTYGVLYLFRPPDGPPFTRQEADQLGPFISQASLALGKTMALQIAHRRASQLATLSKVSTVITSTLNLDTALQRAMDRAIHILNAEAGSLFLMDARRQELTFEVVLGPTGSELVGAKVPVGVGIVGTVAETGEPLIINDVETDPRWNVKFDEATQFRTRDIMCVPMIANNEVIGVIEVINKKDGSTFTEEERDLLLSFGSQAAIAILNAQQFTRTDQALAERVQELQALQMFDQELQASLELPKVLDVTLTRAMDALGVLMGVVGVMQDELPDQEAGLYLMAQRGMPMEMSRYKIDPWPLNRGIIGRVARTGEAVLVNNIEAVADYLPKNHRTRAMLAVPVLREDRVIAIIDLETTEPDYFTDGDLAFIKLLASHAALAIENAQLFEKVRQANDAKTQFMSIASHELKVPMTSIKGYAKLLQMGAGGQLNDQQGQFLSVIGNNVDRMSTLVNDLLDVSRIEAGRIRLELRDVQMQDVIDEVITNLRSQIEQKELSLELNIADDLPEMRADYNRLVQILTNLVSNAYKYTPSGGKIDVLAKPYHNGDLDGVAVTVADTGYGISEEDQAKLFNTFFRAADQNIRNEPGTGLGLAITKKMIESHGGELSFESELGKGTAFTFTMPKVSKIPPGVEVVDKDE